MNTSTNNNSTQDKAFISISSDGLKTGAMLITVSVLILSAILTFFNQFSDLKHKQNTLTSRLERIEIEMLRERTETKKGNRFTQKDGDILLKTIMIIEKRLERIEEKLFSTHKHNLKTAKKVEDQKTAEQ